MLNRATCAIDEKTESADFLIGQLLMFPEVYDVETKCFAVGSRIGPLAWLVACMDGVAARQYGQ